MAVRVPIEVEMPAHGVAVLESRHRADFFMPWRSDPFAKILYILGGSGRLCLGDWELALDVEQLCVVPPKCRHRMMDDRGQPVWLLGLCLDMGNPAWPIRRRFTQLFREVTGETWLLCLRALRIEHACRLLRETGRSTKAIAFECGFESLPQFFRTFRQHKGMTPGQWREG